jgi:Cu+-exporting ATPase
VQYLRAQNISSNEEITDFDEVSGKGISGTINSLNIKIGSPSFCEQNSIDKNETSSFILINNSTKGRFVFTSELRGGISELMTSLNHYDLHVLSGDKDKDKSILESIFPKNSQLFFEQTPKNKLEYIENLKKNGKHVLMIGDGLNDAGALGISDVGIAVSEDVFRFTPSSDAIIEANKLASLAYLLSISNFSKTVLKVCLLFSISYNIVGLSFAISGNLTPLVAAILMPISSITVVLLSTLFVRLKK